MDPNAPSEPVIRMLLVGDQSVGKSSLTACFAKGVGLTPDLLSNYSATIGIELTTISARHAPTKQDVKLEIWDSAGRERSLDSLPLFICVSANWVDQLCLSWMIFMFLGEVMEEESDCDVQFFMRIFS